MYVSRNCRNIGFDHLFKGMFTAMNALHKSTLKEFFFLVTRKKLLFFQFYFDDALSLEYVMFLNAE